MNFPIRSGRFCKATTPDKRNSKEAFVFTSQIIGIDRPGVKVMSAIGHNSEHSGNWVRVSRSRPCPKCGKPDNCTVSADGGAVWCGRVDVGAVRQNAGGQWLHLLADRPGWAPLPPRPEPKKRKSSGSPAVAAELYRRAYDLPRRLLELATDLGVSVESLRSLGVGWSGAWWSIPERSASGLTIGIQRRWKDGRKYQLPGGARGLAFMPGRWSRGDGPILIVEGASDVCALDALGLASVGRPGASAGADDLAQLLGPIDENRPVWIVAEDDRLKGGKPRELPASHRADCPACQMCWPGLAGARSVAASLAVRLDRDVRVVLPGGGHKDCRVWLKSHIESNLTLAELAGVFLAEVVEVGWEHPPKLIVPPPPAGPSRTLEDWRAEMLARRLESLDAGEGVWLDRSPCGAGKSHATGELIAEAGAALLVVRTHEFAAEVAEDLRKRGVTAEVFPKRVCMGPGVDVAAVNCWSEWADVAERAGLSVVGAVCPGCPFQDSCKLEGGEGYLAKLASANKSPVVLATHSRAAVQGLADLVGDRDLVVIDEDCETVFRPSAEADISSVRDVAAVLDWLRNNPTTLGTEGTPGGVDDDVFETLDALDRAAAAMLANMEGEGHAVRSVRLPPPVEIAPGVQRRAWLAMLRAVKAGIIRELPNDGVWRVVLGAVDRKNLADVVTTGDESSREVLACWRKGVPGNRVVWLLDATQTVAKLRHMLPGANLIDATPAGHLPQRVPAVVVPVDVTRSQKGTRVAGLLRGVLADRPEAVRVGVVCHRPHFRALEELREAGGELGARIARVTWFGRGDGRGSNRWLDECDLIVVLGTPRPGRGAVRNSLLLTGELEAAAMQSPEWSRESRCVLDLGGDRRTVVTGGYTDPRWQEAYRELVLAELRQWQGRGRGILSNGIPVVILTTEDIGLEISDRPTAAIRLGDGPANVLSALEGLGDAIRAQFPKKDIGPSARIRVEDLCASTGLGRRIVQRHLAVLESRGLVVRRDGGRSTTWEPVRSADGPPVDSPATGPVAAVSVVVSPGSVAFPPGGVSVAGGVAGEPAPALSRPSPVAPSPAGRVDREPAQPEPVEREPRASDTPARAPTEKPWTCRHEPHWGPRSWSVAWSPEPPGNPPGRSPPGVAPLPPVPDYLESDWSP